MSKICKAVVPIPEGAAPGTVLAIPVKGGTEKVKVRVPPGLGPGSTLVLTQADGSDDWKLEVGDVVPLSFEVEVDTPLGHDISPERRSAEQVPTTTRPSDFAQQRIPNHSLQLQLEFSPDHDKPSAELDNCPSIFSTKHIDAEQECVERQQETGPRLSSLASPSTLVETSHVTQAASSELSASDGAEHPTVNFKIIQPDTRQATYATGQQDRRLGGEYAAKLAQTAQQAAMAAQDAAAQAQQALLGDLDHAAALAQDAQEAAQIAQEAASKAQEALQMMYIVPNASPASLATRPYGICDVQCGQVYRTGDSPRFGATSALDESPRQDISLGVSQKQASQVRIPEVACAELSTQSSNPLHNMRLSDELPQDVNSQHRSPLHEFCMSTLREKCTKENMGPIEYSFSGVSGENMAHLRALQGTDSTQDSNSLHSNSLHVSHSTQDNTDFQYEGLLRDEGVMRYTDPSISEDRETHLRSLQGSCSIQDRRRLQGDLLHDMSPVAHGGTPHDDAPMQNTSPRQGECASYKDYLQNLQEDKQSHADDESGCFLM